MHMALTEHRALSTYGTSRLLYSGCRHERLEVPKLSSLLSFAYIYSTAQSAVYGIDLVMVLSTRGITFIC